MLTILEIVGGLVVLWFLVIWAIALFDKRIR